MTELFSRTFHARWGDMDFNGHMRNTAYLDVAADVRMLYFEDKGFPMREFERLRIGPVIMRDALEYYRELRLLQTFTVTLALAGLSEDGSRFTLVNELQNQEHKRIAKVTSEGGWLNLDVRKMTVPPPVLLRAMEEIGHTADFQVIPKGAR